MSIRQSWMRWPVGERRLDSMSENEPHCSDSSTYGIASNVTVELPSDHELPKRGVLVAMD